MSEYPKPTSSNIFNPIDFNQTTNNQESDIDTSNLVKRSGDNMIGTLTLPVLKFSDNTEQTTAYVGTNISQYQSDTSENTYKLEKTSRVNQYTFVDDLKVDDIQFMNGKQNQAFLDVDKTQIYTNQGKLDLISIESNNRFRLTSDNKGLNKIELDARSLLLFYDNNLYGEIGVTSFEETMTIKNYNNANILIEPGYNDLIIKSSNVRLENNFNDYESHLHLDNIHIGSGIQTKAYTNDDYDKLQAVDISLIDMNTINIQTTTDNLQNLITTLNGKILIKYDRGWEILNRGQFVNEYIPLTTTYYNILSHPSMHGYSHANFSSRQWAVAPKRLRIKYSINFQSVISDIGRFKSKIMLMSPNYGGGEGQPVVVDENTIDESLFMGEHNHITKAYNFYEYINYGDELIVDISHGMTLYLYTEYRLDCRGSQTLDMQAKFCIEEL